MCNQDFEGTLFEIELFIQNSDFDLAQFILQGPEKPWCPYTLCKL